MHGTLDPYESPLPPINGISIGSAIFAQLTRVTITETDRHIHVDNAVATSVAIGRSLCTACRQCSLKTVRPMSEILNETRFPPDGT